MGELNYYKELGIPVIDNTKNYWMIRTKGGIYFNDFFLNDYVAIGWDEIVDLELMTELNREALTEK